MTGNRIFAIGDIHGCLDKLQALIEILPLDPIRDTFVFLGDYIDRGPHSRQVIDHLLRLKADLCNTLFLMGNHEKMFLDYLNHINPLLFLLNGGQTTIDAYAQRGQVILPREHRVFFEGLQLIYETPKYFFVHAGLRPAIPLIDQRVEDMLWIRESFFSSLYDFGKKVIFGHTPFTEPLVMQNKIGIDTGAVYGNKLTCIELPGEKFYQV